MRACLLDDDYLRDLKAEIIQAKRLAIDEHGVRLAGHAGLHTGLVVVGEMAGDDQQGRLALGDTPNIAARLQALAGPSRVVLSATTDGLVRLKVRQAF
jgi:class 3 adenylate cyclase